MKFTQQQFSSLSITIQREYILKIFQDIQQFSSSNWFGNLTYLLELQDVDKAIRNNIYCKLLYILQTKKVSKHELSRELYDEIKNIIALKESDEDYDAEEILSLLP